MASTARWSPEYWPLDGLQLCGGMKVAKICKDGMSAKAKMNLGQKVAGSNYGACKVFPPFPLKSALLLTICTRRIKLYIWVTL